MRRFLATLLLTTACLLALPGLASAQFSIQTPDLGLTVGPDGGVGIRLGAPTPPPPPPTVYVVPAPVVQVAPPPSPGPAPVIIVR